MCVAAFFARQSVPWLVDAFTAIALLAFIPMFVWRRETSKNHLWLMGVVLSVSAGLEFLSGFLKKPDALSTTLEGIAFLGTVALLWGLLKLRLKKV
jgi:hypothetical protein